MGYNHLTIDSRNHVENKVIIEIWIFRKIATIHSVILIGHTNSGYDPHVAECTVNAGACFWYWLSQDRYPARPQPGRWWVPGLSWVSLEAAECVDPWCPTGVRWGSGLENVLSCQLCQCPHPLKIADTLLPHGVGHCRVWGETLDRLH